jgi:hypothetical protein
VSWGIKKVYQARRCAAWLAQADRPVIFGADANTPEYGHG